MGGSWNDTFGELALSFPLGSRGCTRVVKLAASAFMHWDTLLDPILKWKLKEFLEKSVVLDGILLGINMKELIAKANTRKDVMKDS